MNITLESIRGRTSVRSYDPAPLSQADKAAITAAFEGCSPGPFGGRPRLALVEAGAFGSGGRIGTYGVIRGAQAYVVGAISPGPMAFVDYGYCLEGVVLAAAALGLGTCWLGGLFNRKDAMKALKGGTDDVVPAVSPIGRPAEGGRHLLERAIRGAAGSENRKPFGSLFFDGGFGAALSAEEAGDWAEVLECVRIGPSASNKQPWRILRTGESGGSAFHLFLDEDLAYSRAIPGIVLQDLDAGIAMRHFEAAAQALGLAGAWSRGSNPPDALRASFKYIASWEY